MYENDEDYYLDYDAVENAAWFDYMSDRYGWPYFAPLVNLVRRNPQAATWTVLLHLAD